MIGRKRRLKSLFPFSGIVPDNWAREYGLEVRYRWR